jgi:hypothetical protein
MRRSAKVLLLCALAVQVLFLASLIDPGHFLNALFPEGTHNLGEGQGSDFYAFYQAGRYVLDGDDIYRRPMEDPERVVPYAYFYRYLPFLAYTIGVAANAVPPRVAYWIWVALLECVLLLVVRATLRMTTDRSLAAKLAAMWLMFTPFYMELYMGQVTFLMSALVFAYALASARGRRAASDAWWIASVLLKHLTILFVPIFVRTRRLKPVIVAGALLVATTVPYLILRPVGVGAFTHDNFSLNLNPMAGNFGVLALLMVLKMHFFPAASEAFAQIGPLRLTVTRLLVAVTMGLPVLTALWITFKRKPFDFLESLAAWSLVYFFIFREVWEYHYVLLLPVFVLLYARTRARVLWVIYAWTALPTLFIFYDVPAREPQAEWSTFVHVLNHSFKVVPVVWLFLWITFGCLRRHAAQVCSTSGSGLALEP